MADIKPFKGYRYNIEKIADLGSVVSPPYYNIKPYEKEALYNMSEYNSVRLFSGMKFDTDNTESNKFTRAHDYLSNWIKNGILVRDKKDAIYMYEQTITVHNVRYNNRAFVALVKLEGKSSKKIMSCEEIREVSKQDRYKFLLNTNADLSMISCLYMEREKELLNLMDTLSENDPDLEFSSNDVTQRLWEITDKKTISYITEKFSDLPIYITDGQTRYETCLMYRDYMKKNNPNHTGEEPYNYTMVSLSNSRSDGIVILPVHRAVKLVHGFREDYFVSGIQDHFKIEKIIVDRQDDDIITTMKKQIATVRNENIFAVYHGGNYFYRLTLKDKSFIGDNIYPEKSTAYCSLDTVVLNELIFKELFGIKTSEFEKHIQTSRSARKCFDMVENGEADFLVLTNPVKTEQIRNVTSVGEKLPKRSISVFPKPSVGILINVKEK